MATTADRIDVDRIAVSRHASAAGDPIDWIDVARNLATEFAASARKREQNRTKATEQIARFKQSGLLALSIPKAYGGEGLDWATLARIVREIARGDTSLALLLGVHYIGTAAVWIHGVHESGADFLKETVENRWYIGVVFNPLDPTLSVEVSDNELTIDGWKSFCTGAPLADRILVMAQRADTKALVNLVVSPDAGGLAISADWDAIGMRLGDSSSVRFESVKVARESLVGPAQGVLESTPWLSLFGLQVWLLYSNYYLGAGLGALAYAKHYTRTITRPWISTGLTRASDDPYILELYGRVHIELRGAELLLDRAAIDIEQAILRGPSLTEAERGEAAISLFTARVATARAALDATSQLFEAMGARSATDRIGFDRFWRDVRTHSLHHPLAWKTREVGDWALNGTYPNYKSGYA
jgi:alkylation response protein AidB-like acyl-CoA dehydrogenase